MGPDPFRTPEKPSSATGPATIATISSSRVHQQRPPPLRLPPSPTDSAISFDSPLPRQSRKRTTTNALPSSPPRRWSISVRSLRSIRRWILILLCIVLVTHLWRQELTTTIPGGLLEDEALRPLRDSMETARNDPVQWLRDHSDDKDVVIDEHGRVKSGLKYRWSTRPKAAIISLVRNEELQGIMQSIRQLELRWNHKYRYPWIFFNEKPFSDTFKAATSNLTASPCFYELIPVEHWSTPTWIDQDRYMTSLSYLDHIGVGKGYMLSYHQMCRWNSGFFYKHPALQGYDFYWRVEPDVHFFCDINYDVFHFVRDNEIKYGFNMNILDDARSFPSLWRQTRDFISKNPDTLHPRADLDWLLDSTGNYNNCQFFSNFEIGSLNFFRSLPYEAYFAHLDSMGGFYYERFGDAPIHTLAAALFLSKSETWFFRDIGYQHDIARHCPRESEGRCSCEPTGLDENFYKLVPMESPQQKPEDSCIRAWMGGDWVEKKEGWSMEAERSFGGDGYHGYIKDGI